MPFKKKEEVDCTVQCEQLKKEVEDIKKSLTKLNQVGSLKRELTAQKKESAALKKEVDSLKSQLSELVNLVESQSQSSSSAKDSRVDELIKGIIKNPRYERLRLLYKK